MRKLKPKAMKLRAWKAFSRFIRKRDPYCVTCWEPTSDAGHFIPNGERNAQLRGNALWFDERNVNGQCIKCNRFASGNIAQYAIYLEKKYGHGIIQELHKLRNTLREWTVEELLEIEKRYQ